MNCFQYTITNNVNDMVLKTILQTNFKRGILSEIAKNGAKAKTIKGVQYYTNITLTKNAAELCVEPIVEPVIVQAPELSELEKAKELKRLEFEFAKELKQMELLEMAKQRENDIILKKIETENIEKLKKIETENIEKLKKIETENIEKLKKIDAEEAVKQREFEGLLKQAEIDVSKEKILSKERMHEKELAYRTKENNFKRCMNLEEIFVKDALQRNLITGHSMAYDVPVYGNPSEQCVDANSLKIHHVFAEYLTNKTIDQDAVNNINSVFENKINKDLVYLNGEKTELELVRIVDALGIQEELIGLKQVPKEKRKLTESYEITNIKPYLNKVPDNAKSDTKRIFKSLGQENYALKTSLEGRKSASQDLEYYLYEINGKSHDEDKNKTTIKCFTCNTLLDYNTINVEKLHDIPKSKNGNYSRENIKLGCRACNLAMGSETTLTEFVFVKMLKYLKESCLILGESPDTYLKKLYKLYKI